MANKLIMTLKYIGAFRLILLVMAGMSVGVVARAYVGAMLERQQNTDQLVIETLDKVLAGKKMIHPEGHSCYSYAGGTYYAFKLCWFYDCPDEKKYEELVHVKHSEDVFDWHISHDTRDTDGDKYTSRYHGKMQMTDELRRYCKHQRDGQEAYKATFNKDTKPKVLTMKDLI